MTHPRSLFHFFYVNSIQAIQFLQKNMVKKCPSSYTTVLVFEPITFTTWVSSRNHYTSPWCRKKVRPVKLFFHETTFWWNHQSWASSRNWKFSWNLVRPLPTTTTTPTLRPPDLFSKQKFEIWIFISPLSAKQIEWSDASLSQMFTASLPFLHLLFLTYFSTFLKNILLYMNI